MTSLSFPQSTKTYPLSGAQVEQYRRDGFVRLREVADVGAAAAVRDPISAAVAQHRTQIAALAERDTYGMAFLQVMNLWREDPEVACFVLADRFAGIAARLLGVERVRVYHDQALYKEPGGGPTPWHQDAMYWPLDGARCLTMWMPLVDITPNEGGLQFAVGTHTTGPLSDIGISDASEDYFDQLLREHHMPVDQPPAMRAGDASFHSGWTVHRALPNRGTRMREVITIIWFADGLKVQEPANDAQVNDLHAWLPGLAPGEPAAGAINPVAGA